LTIFLLTSFAIVFSYLLGSCRKYPSSLHQTALKQEIPDSFPLPQYRFENNPLTQEGFDLGRRLFYEGLLSVDSIHSCASCHQQIAAFGTYEHDRSHGVHNTHTLRNAPVLFNLAWGKSFHWDGEFSSFQDEPIQPINGDHEMGASFQLIIDRLEQSATYREMFQKAFRYPIIRPEFILKALAQFTGYMVSANSKYDRYKKGTDVFTPQELNGYQLYKAKCATCHPEPLFTDYSYRNIGLPVDGFLNDYGRMRITGKKEDSLKFKVPTLRNVYISENYMHDGRFNTLAQVINHYRTGIQQSATLDPLLVNGISLTNSESTDLALFLRALTDSTFITDRRFSKPN
jgi:cytochrome c peroxidase